MGNLFDDIPLAQMQQINVIPSSQVSIAVREHLHQTFPGKKERNCIMSCKI